MDTGPVLLQRRVEIGPDATAGSLYYDALYPQGIEMLVESVALVEAGNAPKMPQDEAGATYEKPAEGRLARIDWRRPLAEVYNLIRGCDPSPGAWTRWDDKSLRVLVQGVDGTRGAGRTRIGW
jgi:methionyl-tRNA formyltransferase